jgi:hypothetical protein
MRSQDGIRLYLSLCACAYIMAPEHCTQDDSKVILWKSLYKYCQFWVWIILVVTTRTELD